MKNKLFYSKKNTIYVFLYTFASMFRLTITILLTSLFTILSAQTPKEEIALCPDFAASNSVAYQVPTEKLTPAPKGYIVFYLSHYGRHGSRYLTKIEDYEYVLRTMRLAEEEGKLTPLGKDVQHRVTLLSEQAKNRWGDLTKLGSEQIADISKRMVKNYPELFKGNAHINARSTLMPRCQLSMTAALIELTRLRPHLNYSIFASGHDLHYMNFQDKILRDSNKKHNTQSVYDEFANNHLNYDRLLNSLFNDTAFIRKNVDAYQFNYYLFRLAGNIQDTDYAGKMTLWDIYTKDEIYENWQVSNAWWFLGFGFTPLNGNKQPFTQRNLIRQIITDADDAIRGNNVNVDLRFGHDTMILPLVCLMGINGYDASIGCLDSLVSRGWFDYKVFPMASNIQIAFYKNKAKNNDVIIKILLNEKEASLPVKTDIAPYYHWADVKKYLLNIIDNYKE